MQVFRFTLLLCALTIAGAGNAVAQHYIKDCAHAKTVADTMACVKKRADDAQSELNELYKLAINNQQKNGKTSLGETQQGWFAYRDAQCSWEAAQAETGHEKIYEFSCIAALTEERIAVLRAMNDLATSDKPREFSSHPRWMNALAGDYPDVFWRYNQWVQADIDCDDEEEEVMTGISMKYDKNGNPYFRSPDKDSVKEGFYAGPLYRGEAVIAVSDNPRTGLSKTTLFRLPIGKDADSLYFCDMPQSIEAITETGDDQNEYAKADSESDLAEKSPDAGACAMRLQVSDGNCPPAFIYWDGSKYQLEKQAQKSAEGKNKNKE